MTLHDAQSDWNAATDLASVEATIGS